MNGKRMPECMSADRERRPTHPHHQVIDMAIDRLPGHFEDAFILFELTGPDVALHPVLKQGILYGDVAFGGTME